MMVDVIELCEEVDRIGQVPLVDGNGIALQGRKKKG